MFSPFVQENAGIISLLRHDHSYHPQLLTALLNPNKTLADACSSEYVVSNGAVNGEW